LPAGRSPGRGQCASCNPGCCALRSGKVGILAITTNRTTTPTCNQTDSFRDVFVSGHPTILPVSERNRQARELPSPAKQKWPCQSTQSRFRHSALAEKSGGCSKCPRTSGRVLCTHGTRRRSRRDQSGRPSYRARRLRRGDHIWMLNRVQPRGHPRRRLRLLRLRARQIERSLSRWPSVSFL